MITLDEQIYRAWHVAAAYGMAASRRMALVDALRDQPPTNQCCHGCPFAYTEASEAIQNYGCLPTPQEIVTMRVEHGRTWACHSDTAVPCRGALQHLCEHGLPFKVINPALVTEQDEWHRYTR